MCTFGFADYTFFQAISNYLKNNEFNTGEVHQLRLEFEKVSGKDLNWFFNQWYYGKGNPKINIEKNYNPNNHKLSLKIIQNQGENLFFQFPLEVDIYQGHDNERIKIWVEAKKENNFEFNLFQKPSLVNINPRGVILMRENINLSEKELLFQIKNTKEFKSRFLAIDFAYKNKYKSVLLLGINDPSPDIRLQVINYLSTINLNRKDLKKIEKIALHDKDNLVKAAAMWILANTENNKYLPIFKKGLYTSSNSIKNAAIHGVSILAPKEAKPILRDSKVEKFTSEQLISLSSVIIDNKIEKYLDKLIPYFIYYPSYELQGDNKKANYFKKGLYWAMNIDNMDYVQQVINIFKEAHPYYEKGSPSYNQMIEVLDFIITTKQKLKPTKSILHQIELLQNFKATL